MNGAVEDLLREGLDRLTAEVGVPAGVTGRARAHLRRKKMAVRAALAGGAAAVTAAAVVAATLPGQGAAGPLQARTAAYVVSRVTAALAANNKVVQTTTTFSAPFPAVHGWAYGGGFRAIQSGYIAPAEMPGSPWAQGRVSWGAGTANVGGKQIYVQVDYRHHEWYRTAAMNFVPSGCTTRLDIVEFNGPTDWAPFLRQALSCGTVKVAGHAWVGGIRTIKLSGSGTDTHFWGSLPGAVGRGPVRVDVTFYVNPATYFPVLAVWRNLSHWRDGKVMRGTVRQAISLLPSSPANKTLAVVPIPASFRRVHGAPFGGPVSAYFTSG
jgi:hypothetical protein